MNLVTAKSKIETELNPSKGEGMLSFKEKDVEIYVPLRFKSKMLTHGKTFEESLRAGMEQMEYELKKVFS